MKLINPQVFFKKYETQMGLYVLALEAMPVKNGYSVGGCIYDRKEFQENFDPISTTLDESLPYIPRDSTFTQVHIGDVISIGMRVFLAEADGFILKHSSGEKHYYSDGIFRKMYRVNAIERSDGGALVVGKYAPVFEGIILAKDVCFDFKGGPHHVSPGGIIYKNPKEPDGFTTRSASRGSIFIAYRDATRLPNRNLVITPSPTVAQYIIH
jgi:hypothetical protein